MEELKPRERQILEFMKKQIARKGYPPTVREINAALGIKSTSTTHKDIERLEHKGYIRKDPSKPRAIMITDSEGPGTAGGVSIERHDVIDIPLVGRIAAGEPITTEQNIEEFVPVPASYVKGENFMLRVQGDSMIEAGIFDGDLILVQQQQTADNGDIVVAMIDGFESEATVKTFYKEEGHIRLQPQNSTMSPIIVNDVSVLGKVKGVFRYLN
ncbi:MAG: transcriptional repressor LexA [Clostridiales Family XIII bacterium]|jgi:repressor LexA|nr:transcriptional repressor LexA [Clostridiales Family XIII bacterium]